MSLELNPKETTKKVFSSKSKFVPKPVVIDYTSANILGCRINADLQKGYFDNFPEVENIMRIIVGKCISITANSVIKEIPFTNLEAVTLKANDYIRDKYFRLPLWYQGGLYSY